MRSDIKTRFGKTRGTPEHFFRVQVSRDGRQSFTDALVMKRDDGDGPDRNSTPYRVVWAATKELEQEVEAALSRLEKRFSAKHTKNELRKFLKAVPRHYVPPDAEIPVDLGVRIANAPVGLGVHAGTEPNDWEQQADAAARRRAGIADRANDLPGKARLLGLVRSRFPGWLGFRDPRFDGGPYDEVQYKLATVAKAKELLSEQTLRSLIDAGDRSTVIERLKTIGRDTNLLFRPYSPGGDLDLLYHEDLDHRRFCEAFLDLLYGDGDAPQRLDRYSEQVRSMNLRPNVNRWAMPSYFLFFLHPDEEVLIKPRTVRTLLELGGWGGRLGVEPSGEEYARVRTAYSELRAALEEHEPRHMIDVQGFAWVAVQEANERAMADKRAREAGHEPDPRIEQAMAEFEQEADAHDLIERQELLDRAQGRFEEIFGTVAKIESLSASDFFGFFNELDTHGGRTSGLFSPNLAFPKNRNTQAYRDFEDDLPAFREALVTVLHGAGTDAERLDSMWEIGSGVRRYITTSLPIPSALLFLQTPTKWSGILHMAAKEKKLAAANIGPAVADDVSLGERFVALERTLIQLPLKYGRKNWGPMTTAAFFFSPAFERHFADPPIQSPTLHRSLTSLIQSLKDQGLYFPREAVANYLLALQTKRFAILTGISGTGKTKIAKVVAQHFEHIEQTRVAKISDDTVGVKVQPSYIRHSKLVLPVAISAHLRIGAGTGPGSGPDIWVRYPGDRTRLRTYVTAGQHLMLMFKGDFKTWFQSTFKVGDQFWICVHPSETDDPDELEIGLPETDVVEQRANNYVVVPVRPDWVDNRGLLGYLNPLTGDYSTTPFLNLLLRAHDEEQRAKNAGEKPHPFFVILDEMNLARVEHYFSDFLSALESGEDIPLHENEAIESGESESGPQVPRQLKVPGNVLFTGTVNVDETTYMFSPKVLDRAFTIEFDQVDLKGFSKDISSEDTSGLNLGSDQGPLDLLPSGQSDDDDWKPSRADWMEFSKKTAGHHKALLRLHSILEEQHRHFGYRVANEIARFVNLAREQAAEADTDAAVDAAFDLALLQKVLPKFHGTQQELESLLKEIFQFAVLGGGHVPKKDQTVELADWKVVKGRLETRCKAKAPSQASSGDPGAEGNETDSNDPETADTGTKSPAYPRTGAKVLRMLNRLRDRGFTSFVE